MMYEQIMNKVRRKGEGEKERGFIVSLQGEHTYPVRLNQKRVEEDDGWWESKGEDGCRAEKTG